MALVLLAGATLLARSFHEIRSIDPGFDPANTMSYTVGLPETSYSQLEPTLALHQSVLDGLASFPGVQEAGAVNLGPPFGGMVLTMRVRAEDQPEENVVGTESAASSPGYFRAMGMSVISGRGFSPQDDASAPGVTVVGTTLAELLWPESDPVGRRIVLGPERTLTVVGVVEDIVRYGPTTLSGAVMFQPLAQVQDVRQLRQMNYVVRAGEISPSLSPGMREIMRQADSDIPAGRFASLDQLVVDAMGDRIFQARLLQAFAGLAVLLAGIGVYGVMAYSVAERTREMGIRMALGGRPGQLIGATISRVARLVLAGIAVGTLGAYGMGHLLTAWLYSVSPGDPVTYVVSVLILVSVALVAALGPVRRAVRVSPAEVLSE
jgi:predicted permease